MGGVAGPACMERISDDHRVNLRLHLPDRSQTPRIRGGGGRGRAPPARACTAAGGRHSSASTWRAPTTVPVTTRPLSVRTRTDWPS